MKTKWQSEVPAEPGWYLWRVSPPGDVSAVEPFLVYELPGGYRYVQEWSDAREGTDRGGWSWSRVGSVDTPSFCRGW